MGQNRANEVSSCSKFFSTGVMVEVGCGGRKVHANCLGVDPIPRGNTSTLGQACVAEHLGTATELHKFFKPKSVNRIFAIHAVHYEQSLPLMFSVWNDVLEIGGIFVIIDLEQVHWEKVATMPQFQINWKTAEQYEAKALKKGFRTIQISEGSSGWSFLLAMEKVEDWVKGLKV